MMPKIELVKPFLESSNFTELSLACDSSRVNPPQRNLLLGEPWSQSTQWMASDGSSNLCSYNSYDANGMEIRIQL